MTERLEIEAKRQRDALWKIWELVREVDWDECLVCADVVQLCEQALWRGEVEEQ